MLNAYMVSLTYDRNMSRILFILGRCSKFVFSTLSSVLRKYKQYFGMGIAAAILCAIFVPFQNLQTSNATYQCPYIYDPVQHKYDYKCPDPKTEHHKEASHRSTVINNHVTIINQAIAIAIASASGGS